mmetsp:Transcript_6430/g.18397  ORF Transcript_6430/g.18397 Transcript_6430/m.18397 type:complete len:686 (-) Transcript_6430:459-2516(-)
MSDSSCSGNNNTNGASPFRDAVFSSKQEQQRSLPPNMRYGENGCPEFSDLGSDLLTLSQMVRFSKPSDLCDQLLSSSSVDDVSALIILTFVTRNIRGGKGERDLSYDMFLKIWQHYPETAKKLLPLFARHYGCWKDCLLLAERCKADDQEDKDSMVSDSGDLMESILGESIRIMRAQFRADLDELARYEAKTKAKARQGATADGENDIDDDWDVVLQNETQVIEDTTTKSDGGPKISLLAKWLPRENTHFDKKLDFVRRFLIEDNKNKHASDGQTTSNNDNDNDNDDATDPNPSEWRSGSKRRYRKDVSKLTSFLSLPEVLLSANRADEIDFHMLASRATLKLSRALLNETARGSVRRPNDAKRQKCAEMFVDHLTREGLKGGALMPDEIVAEIMKGNVSPMREKVLDAQWKDLWKNVVEQVEAQAKEENIEFDLSKMVPLSDVSGSMSGKPMEVSIAMGIGISEITHPAFRNIVLTFETQPQWHKLNEGDSIVKKVQSLERAPWGADTNFEAAYEQILEVCREHRLAREDVPTLIVFSDMQFNVAQGYGSDMVAMHDTIRKKFAATARELGWYDPDPTPIVYWNVRDTVGHPVESDTEGAVLLSGFSPSLLKMVMNGEALKDEEVEVLQADGTVRTEKVRVTAAEVLTKILNDPLYDPVREVLVSIDEGVLKDYCVQAPVHGSV